MGYKPKQKNKFSNFAFPTPFAVDYARPIYDDTISQVTYNTPSYGSTLAPVIDSAKTSSSVAPVVTPPISAVTTPESLNSFIASNAYSNRAAYYEQVQANLGNVKATDINTDAGAFTKQFEQAEAIKESHTVGDAVDKAKADSDAKAKEEAAKVLASLQEAKNQANAPSGNKQADTTETVDSVTPVAKAKSSNAMLYIGVIAIGIVGLMLLKNK